MACCPFHDDKNPSMKVDQRFHCFGCGEDGDVIDFTAKLFDLSPKEAAEKLAQDFGLIYDSQAPPRRRYVRQKNEAQKFREDRQRCYRVLSDYYYLLKKWEADRSPRTPEEEPHPRFVEAIQKKAYVEYLLDLFLYESEEEQKAWIAEHTAEITHLERRLKIMAENKPTNRERLREITDGIEQGIKELFESEKYMRYLSVMSRFHRYSVNNTMLIYMQKPDATLVAGFSKWRDTFHRTVKKGEKGIQILAPIPYKKKVETEKVDAAGQPAIGPDGKPMKEIQEIDATLFRVAYVFDVSQTEGKELPTIGVAELGGDVVNYDKMLEGLRQVSPVPIGFEEIAAGAKGYYSPAESRIAIQQGMSELQTIKTAIHEIAHAKLHAVTPDEKAAPEDKKDRRTKEVEAESIAYTVCQHFGIDTSDYSFGYVAGWSSGKEMKELRASMEVIRGTAHEIILELDGHMGYRDLQREITQAQPREEKAGPKRKSPAKAAGRKKKHIRMKGRQKNESVFFQRGRRKHGRDLQG